MTGERMACEAQNLALVDVGLKNGKKTLPSHRFAAAAFSRKLERGSSTCIRAACIPTLRG